MYPKPARLGTVLCLSILFMTSPALPTRLQIGSNRAREIEKIARITENRGTHLLMQPPVSHEWPPLPEMLRRVVAYTELREQANHAMNNAYHAMLRQADGGADALARSLRVPYHQLDHQGRQRRADARARFIDLVRKEFGGSFVYLDTPKAFGHTDPYRAAPLALNGDNVVDTIPADLMTLFVLDHHNDTYAEYYDPHRPKRNTAMQALDYIETVLDHFGGVVNPSAVDHAERFIQESTGRLTTDNFADAMEAMLIFLSPRPFLEDPALRQQLRAAEYLVDFAIFAGDTFERVVQAGQGPAWLRQATGHQLADQDILDGIALGKAILMTHSDTIADPQVGMAAGDRFHVVAGADGKLVARSAQGQVALIARQLEGLMALIDDPSLRARQADRFDAKRSEGARMVELISMPGSDPRIAAYYALDPTTPLSDGSPLTLFPAWGAPGVAHDAPFSLEIKRRPGASGEAKESELIGGFILSHLEGRPAGRVDLSPYADAMVQAHVENAVAQGDAAEAAGAYAKGVATGKPPLAFSFFPLDVSVKQALELAANVIGER